MLLKKSGLPEENELVSCKVVKIQHNSVSVDVLEYGKQGIIHISEISPGRIRNIRDYVKVGKVIICKVLHASASKGYISLSLRRVNEGQRRQKVSEMKQEQLAENIVEHVTKQHKLDLQKFYDDIFGKLNEEYDGLYGFFEDVVAGEAELKKLALNKDVEKTMYDTITQRIKPQVYEMYGIVGLTTYESDGIGVIKKVLNEAGKKGVDIHYRGGGKYTLHSSDTDVKNAKATLNNAQEYIVKNFQKHGEASFEMVDDRR